MESRFKYICPKECAGRSATCHSECERYKAFCEANEREKLARHEERCFTDAFLRKIARRANTRYKSIKYE